MTFTCRDVLYTDGKISLPVYKVYWTRTVAEYSNIKTDRIFSKDVEELSDMLKFVESLRKERRNGAPITFITSVSENLNVVGEAGVADVSADYNWTKRRGGRYQSQRNKFKDEPNVAKNTE